MRLPDGRSQPHRCVEAARVRPVQIIVVLAVLVMSLALGGCGNRGSMSATAGSHTPGMTDYENKMLFTDSPEYTKYDLH